LEMKKPAFTPPKTVYQGVSAPTDHSPSGVRTWIRTLCRQIGTTPTQLATTSGLAATTLNRFMRSTDPKKNISASTIARLIAGVLQMNEEGGFVERAKSLDQERGYHNAELADVSVLGRAHLGIFVKEFQWGPVASYVITVPIPSPYFALSLFALEVSDNHAEPAFKQGSLVIAIPFFGNIGELEVHTTVVSGERVVLLTTNKKNEVETTIREFAVSPNEDVWLLAIDRKRPDIYAGKKFALELNDYNIGGRIIMSIQPDRNVTGGAVLWREKEEDAYRG
jgi:hypothetical protein